MQAVQQQLEQAKLEHAAVMSQLRALHSSALEEVRRLRLTQKAWPHVTKKKKKKFTLFSDHDGSLLGRQPGAIDPVYTIRQDSQAMFSYIYAALHLHFGHWQCCLMGRSSYLGGSWIATSCSSFAPGFYIVGLVAFLDKLHVEVYFCLTICGWDGSGVVQSNSVSVHSTWHDFISRVVYFQAM